MTDPTIGLDLILAISEHADAEAADLKAEAAALRAKATQLEDRAGVLLQLHRIATTDNPRNA